MSESMTGMDWSTPEYLGNITAEELYGAMERLGIRANGCWAADDGSRINISFADIRDAEAMVSLGVVSDFTPGSTYDRAAASCVTLASFAERGVDPSESEMGAAMDAAWNWTIHPAMDGRRMGWHVSVDLPTADAQSVVADLNAMRQVGSR